MIVEYPINSGRQESIGKYTIFLPFFTFLLAGLVILAIGKNYDNDILLWLGFILFAPVPILWVFICAIFIKCTAQKTELNDFENSYEEDYSVYQSSYNNL